MKTKFTKHLLTLGAAVLMLFATTTSASACLMGLYQPEEPKCLRK